MPINRYHIRNVNRMADPELYKAADKDDPEALLEGVAMAGLIGLLRQLGDLAEFATEIFHELHEEMMATAARGHSLLLRVQQFESEIPPIERAFLSQTSRSSFFSCSGIDWHPNRQATQNLITTGNLPRFVMDSYEDCRGPPRLFLLDKFDVGGAGACLKRYTDPSIFRVEASSYEINIAKIQREKKIRQTKKKGSIWDQGETPEVSQSSHAKLHQLFLEERVQTGATEAAYRVKLRKMPKQFPFDLESGESYMNKLLNTPSPAHEVAPIPFNGSSLEDGSITGSALSSPMQNTNPCVSSRKVAESQPSYADLELDDNQITVGAEIHTDGLQNGYPPEGVASETDNYMDVLARMESEVETSITQGTCFDANKHQVQSQLSDSHSIENLTAFHEGSNSITKGMTFFGNSDTKSSSAENKFPVGSDSPPRPIASIEIPFRPQVPFIADNRPVTQTPVHDIRNDTCIDVRKVSIVDQVACLEQGTSDSNEVCSNHTEKLDGPRKSEHQIDKKDTSRCTSEYSDILPIADGLSSFSFVRNLKGDLDNKYPKDRLVPVILLPNIFETTKDQLKYDEENHSTDSFVSSSQSVISSAYELSSGTTYNADIPVTEGIPEGQLKQKGDDILVISDQSETGVSYASGHETESDNLEIESVNVTDANHHECIDYSVLKEGTGTESEEREIEFTYSNVKKDDGEGLEDDTRLECIEAGLVNSEMETNDPVLLPLDVDKHEETGHSVSEQDSMESGKNEEVDELLVVSPDGLDNIDVDKHELLSSQPVNNDLESKSTNHIDKLEAAVSSPLEGNVDQSNNQLHMQLPVETEGSQLGSLTQVDHEKYNDNHLRYLQSYSESYSLLVSEKTPTMESSSHDIFYDQNDIIAPCHSESNVVANVDHDLESKSINHGDHINVFDVPAQPSPLEDKVDKHSSQLHAQIRCLLCSPESYSIHTSQNPPTVELSSHDINLFDQGKHQSPPVLYGFGILPQLAPVKEEDSPPLPPLPPMQWRMGKLQNSLSSPTNGGQHSDTHFPPSFPSTSTKSLRLVGQLTVDETINLNNKNQEPHTQHIEVKLAETMVPQGAVETHRMPTFSYQEVFWPSSNPYPHPLVLDEMQNNIGPMKMQQPCSPLIDAVTSHDKIKLMKVSDRDTTQIPKGEEKDTLLDQIRAKSNFRPAVYTKPSIQGPITNLRVAAILEKANAIRQAFAGSDDDDSDNWSNARNGTSNASMICS